MVLYYTSYTYQPWASTPILALLQNVWAIKQRKDHLFPFNLLLHELSLQQISTFSWLTLNIFYKQPDKWLHVVFLYKWHYFFLFYKLGLDKLILISCVHSMTSFWRHCSKTQEKLKRQTFFNLPDQTQYHTIFNAQESTVGSSCSAPTTLLVPARNAS